MTTTPRTPPTTKDPLKPQATLVMGPTGAGKTRALLTYAKAGIETFIVVTEPTGVETLLDGMAEMDIDPNLVHWNYCPPTNMSIKSLKASADQVNRKSVSDMQKVDSPAVLQKLDYRTYLNFLEQIENFRCDRTGQAFGDATEWGDNRAFCVDSLSGVNLMMTQLQIGNRGTLTLPDYNVVQISLEQLFVTLCSMKCFVTLNAHVEMEPDAITGRQHIMVSTVGKKLAPKVPIHFSEVVLARRAEDGKFWWSTTDPEAKLKARQLPYSDKIAQDFGQIVAAYQKRKAIATGGQSAKTA